MSFNRLSPAASAAGVQTLTRSLLCEIYIFNMTPAAGAAAAAAAVSPSNSFAATPANNALFETSSAAHFYRVIAALYMKRCSKKQQHLTDFPTLGIE